MVKELRDYRQKATTVQAVQWDASMGAVFGVKNKPKKHPMNPDDFHVRTRFGKEIPVKNGDWIITYPDGANDVVEAAGFADQYEKVAGKKVAKSKPESAPEQGTDTSPEKEPTKPSKKDSSKK